MDASRGAGRCVPFTADVSREVSARKKGKPRKPYWDLVVELLKTRQYQSHEIIKIVGQDCDRGFVYRVSKRIGIRPKKHVWLKYAKKKELPDVPRRMQEVILEDLRQMLEETHRKWNESVRAARMKDPI